MWRSSLSKDKGVNYEGGNARKWSHDCSHEIPENRRNSD